jgi:hypothetical protein
MWPVIPKTPYYRRIERIVILFFVIIFVSIQVNSFGKEREQVDLIYDATSISQDYKLIKQIYKPLLVYIVLIMSLIVFGIVFQTAKGYYHYELDAVYFAFFYRVFPFSGFFLYTFISFFFKHSTNNKFIGVF